MLALYVKKQLVYFVILREFMKYYISAYFFMPKSQGFAVVSVCKNRNELVCIKEFSYIFFAGNLVKRQFNSPPFHSL